MTPRGGKMNVRLLESSLESSQYIINRLQHRSHHVRETLTGWNRDFLRSYLNGEAGVQLDISGCPFDKTSDTKLEKIKFTCQKVGIEIFDLDNLPRPIEIEVMLKTGGRCGEDIQSPMPVFLGAGMECKKTGNDVLKLRIRRFTSVVRLYGFNPKLKILGEWPATESTLIESSKFFGKRKIQSLYVGGGIPFATEHGCLKNYTIQSGHELICELSQLDRQIGLRDQGKYSFSDPCPLVFTVDLGFAGFRIEQPIPLIRKGFRMVNGPSPSLPTISEAARWVRIFGHPASISAYLEATNLQTSLTMLPRFLAGEM